MHARPSSRLARALALLAAALAALLPLAAAADPPSRAIRLSYTSGQASFSPAGSDDWVAARINRPLSIGDRVWSAGGNVELQIGGASVRLAPQTALTVLDFDDRLAQFEVTEGSVALHVRSLDAREDVIEFATPSLAFVVRTEGDYRIDVDRDRTAVGVRRGAAEVWGAGNAYRIDRREQFVFYDDSLRDYEVREFPRPDAFERWARERARREDRALSSRYVPPQLVGYVDLDDHGEWRSERDYGAVWYPRVEATWAPYRNGHWAWIDPWGWTWIDDAPWGFAPFHYGRWALVGGRWGWVPGPRDVRPVYAPALVAWVGGPDFSLTLSGGRTRGVAWFPLGPGEVWRPGYDVSREYFTRVNVSNTFVQQTTVINVYDDFRRGAPLRHDYRYRGSGAVTVVPVETFVESRPVHRNVVNINVTQIHRQAPVAAAPPVRPSVQSFIGGAPSAQARPPAETMRRSVVAREAPPGAGPSLQERVNMVRERGRPLDRQSLGSGPGAPQVSPQGSPQASPQASVPRAPAEQAGPRGGPQEGRSGVRVVGTPNAQPTQLPAPGVVQSPRGPVQNIGPSAARGGEEPPRGRGNVTRHDQENRRDDNAEPNRPGPGAQRPQAAPSATPAPAAAPGQPPAEAPRAAPPGRSAPAESAPPRPSAAQPPAAQPPAEAPRAAPPGRSAPSASAPRPSQPEAAKGQPSRPEAQRAAPQPSEAPRAAPPEAPRATPPGGPPAAPAESRGPARTGGNEPRPGREAGREPGREGGRDPGREPGRPAAPPSPPAPAAAAPSAPPTPGAAPAAGQPPAPAPAQRPPEAQRGPDRDRGGGGKGRDADNDRREKDKDDEPRGRGGERGR